MEADDQGRRCSAPTTTVIGFNLLPMELIHCIFFQLALPEIPRLRSVSKSFKSITSGPSFLHRYNLKFGKSPWLFIYTKRWSQDAILKGFTTGFDQWFNFSIKELLASIVHRSHDLYFLTACGNVFLFAINTSKEIVAINLMSKLVKKIPQSPLGPRDTSRWRRSGMKLVTHSGGSGHFRFFFLEYVLQNKLYLFEYDSISERWKSTDVHEYYRSHNLNKDEMQQNSYIFITMLSCQSEHVTLAVGLENIVPLKIVSPPTHYSSPMVEDDQDLMVGLDETASEWMTIYGDGTMLRLNSLNMSINERKKVTVRIELWACLSSNGTQWHWEMISKVPKELLMRQIKNPYGVMRGCLERRNGVVRAVLMSNYEGSWEIIWLSYDMEKCQWTWTLLPDCQMKEANMGGIGFSSGLNLSSLHSSSQLI